MREVKVNKTDLLDKVRHNRTKHVDEYEQAVAGYKKAAVKAIDRAMTRLKGQVESLQQGELLQLGVVTFDLQVPQNHAKDYDQVIKMLEMSVDEQLTVRSDEFACYVMDDWEWKGLFDTVNSTYGVRK